MSAVPELEATAPSRTAAGGRLGRRVLSVLALFAAGGAGAGVLWERLWHEPVGLVLDGKWYIEPAGPDLSFEGVALFVVIAFPLGLVLAVVSGIWRGRETATLVSVLLGACLAAGVMYLVGSALGPDDPQALAAAAPDYTPLDGGLGLTAPDHGRVPWHSSALLALPSGAMAGLVGTYLIGTTGFVRRSRG